MTPTIANNSTLLINSEARTVSTGIYVYARKAFDGHDNMVFDVRRMLRDTLGDMHLIAIMSAIQMNAWVNVQV